jgi:hypothetical protein
MQKLQTPVEGMSTLPTDTTDAFEVIMDLIHEIDVEWMIEELEGVKQELTKMQTRLKAHKIYAEKTGPESKAAYDKAMAESNKAHGKALAEEKRRAEAAVQSSNEVEELLKREREQHATSLEKANITFVAQLHRVKTAETKLVAENRALREHKEASLVQL